MAEYDDNSKITLPQDKSEATRYLFKRLSKLTADKRAYSDHIRDLIKDAKNDHKIAPDQIRTAMKLQRMSPEKREAWAVKMSAAAALFGYSPLGVAEEVDTKSPMWGVIEASKMMHNERADITEEIKGLKAVARERGDIDVDAVSFLLKFDKKDPEERSDWFASIDTTGTFLGLW